MDLGRKVISQQAVHKDCVSVDYKFKMNWENEKCPILIIPKRMELSSGKNSYTVSLNGELHPLTNDSKIKLSNEQYLSAHEPQVEVHFDPLEHVTQEASSVPVFEVIVNPDESQDSSFFMQESEHSQKQAFICLSDDMDVHVQEDEFHQLGENPSLESPNTADLCRICACASSELVSIYSDEGQQLQLSKKIVQHLPITVCEDDRLPLHICETCIAQLNMCHELFRICGEADLRLRVLLDQEDLQKEKQALSVLNSKNDRKAGEKEVQAETLTESTEVKQTSWSSQTTQQEITGTGDQDIPIISNVKSLPAQSSGMLYDGKKPKFKVVVVKLSNTGKTLSREEQIARALEMIKTGDQAKQQGGIEGEVQHASWDGDGRSSISAQWATHSFICNMCNDTITGAHNFLEHQKVAHNVYLHHCSICNAFCETKDVLEQHITDHHPQEESKDNLKITNVAEIQLMNTTQLSANSSNLCMKVSKEFDKMDKSLKSKIVDAIQDMVMQDQLVKFQCSICNEHFSTKESLNKHCKESQHKMVRPINCSLCKTMFKNHQELQKHKQTSHDDLKSFVCNYCEMKFLTKRLLLRHITEHAEYKAFTCPECGKGYNSKTGYEIHLSTHNTEKPYLCDLCGKGFKHVSNLKGHKRSHLSEEDKKRHACTFCEKRFRCKFLVDEHMRLHTGERPFACDKCNKRFYKRQQLKQHTLVHSNKISYECHICSSRFNRRGNMTEHIKKHMTTKRYTCRVCKEGFETISQVVAHRKTHSSEEVAQSKILEDAAGDKEGSSFQCHICQKYLATKLSLVSHLRIHTGEKPFECEFCGQRFSQKPALTYHRRRHTGEKPFVCSYCNEGFLSRNAKNIHERIHTGEKPYSCYVCGTSFRCASSLTQHLMVHSDQRPFTCSHCNKGFRRREALQVHMRIHTGEKPYACDLCGRAFTQRGDMAKHRRTHANERPYRCKLCDLTCTSKKELKKHENLHTLDNLLTSFPEITIVGQDCDSIMLGAEEVQEIVEDEIQ